MYEMPHLRKFSYGMCRSMRWIEGNGGKEHVHFQGQKIQGN